MKNLSESLSLFPPHMPISHIYVILSVMGLPLIIYHQLPTLTSPLDTI